MKPSLLLSLVLLSAAPLALLLPTSAHAAGASETTTAPQASSTADDAKRVFAVGLGGGAVFDHGARGYTSLSLAYLPPLSRRLSLELAMQGALAPRSPADEGLYWGRLTLGLRIELGSGAIRPFVAPRLTHVHMAPVGTWRSHPVESIAGDSEHGLGHRSGIALAAGATWVPSGSSFRLGLCAEQLWLGIGHGPKWFTGMEMTAGVAF